MTNSITGGSGTALRLFQTLARTAAPNDPAAKKTPVLSEQQSAAQAEWEEKQREARATVETLNHLLKQQKDSRRAMASQKVARLKQQIQALRMTSSMGDPKAVARQAARLARELAAAVKEYGAAGAGGLGGLSVAVPASGASASSATNAESTPAAAGAADPAVAASAQAETGSASVTTGPAQASNAAESSVPASEAEKRDALRDSWQQYASDVQKASDEKSADDAFRLEVRKLLNQLKAIIEQQKNRAAQNGTKDKEFDTFDDAIKSVEEALRAMEPSVFDSIGSLGSGMVVNQTA